MNHKIDDDLASLLALVSLDAASSEPAAAQAQEAALEPAIDLKAKDAQSEPPAVDLDALLAPVSAGAAQTVQVVAVGELAALAGQQSQESAEQAVFAKIERMRAEHADLYEHLQDLGLRHWTALYQRDTCWPEVRAARSAACKMIEGQILRVRVDMARLCRDSALAAVAAGVLTVRPIARYTKAIDFGAWTVLGTATTTSVRPPVTVLPAGTGAPEHERFEDLEEDQLQHSTHRPRG